MNLSAMYTQYTQQAEAWVNKNVVSVPKDFVNTSVKTLAYSFALSFVGSAMCATGSRYNAGIKGGCYGMFSAMIDICLRIVAWDMGRDHARDVKETNSPSTTPSQTVGATTDIHNTYKRWVGDATRFAFLFTTVNFRDTTYFGWSCVASSIPYLINKDHRERPFAFGIVAAG